MESFANDHEGPQVWIQNVQERKKDLQRVQNFDF